MIEGHTRKCVGKDSTVDIEKDASQQPEPEQLPAVLNANGLQKIVDYGFRVFERLGTEVGLDTADVDDIHFMLGVFLGKF